MEREPHKGYLVYQGAIPEVQEFLRAIKEREKPSEEIADRHPA